MPQLRAVLVGIPPLLADLTRQVLTRRADVSVVAELSNVETIAPGLLDLAPDVVIIGPPAQIGTLTAARVRQMLPSARVLAISADLLYLLGPGEGVVSEFTPDNLSASLGQSKGSDIDPDL